MSLTSLSSTILIISDILYNYINYNILIYINYNIYKYFIYYVILIDVETLIQEWKTKTFRLQIANCVFIFNFELW